MPHGQEQVIRERKVKLSAGMVYSSYSPHQVERKEGGTVSCNGFFQKFTSSGVVGGGASTVPLGQQWRARSCILKANLFFSPPLHQSSSLPRSHKSAKASINLWSRGILLVLAKVLLKWRQIYGWHFVTINQEILINKVGRLFSWNRGRLCHIVSLIILFIIFD